MDELNMDMSASENLSRLALQKNFRWRQDAIKEEENGWWAEKEVKV